MAKSISFSSPALLTSMLSGFTSRCTQPLAFMKARPVAACLRMSWAFSRMKAASFLWMRSLRLPAGKNSITK